MAFDAFRKNGAPTFYEAVKLPWEGDLITSGLIFCFVILAFSFYVILPGVQGKEKVYTFTRITVSLFIGGVILVSNFAQTWETAEVHTRTKYKAGTGQDIDVTIGVNIGFRGVNITLKGDPDQIKGETIDYNENFNWEGLQGRLGFGPFAGQFNREYRAAQFRGLPLPILWAAEYFTLDGEGIRWGRFYRQAGWYSHIVLWLAFPLWLLANILFFVLLRYGAYFLALTGASMVTANIIWATLRNVNELKIPFTADEVLEFSYGGSFWVCLITGILCIILAVVIFLLDKLAPSAVAAFFGVDVLQDSEQILVEEEEETEAVDQSTLGPQSSSDGTLPPENGGIEGEEEGGEEDDIYSLSPPSVNAPPVPGTDRARPYIMRPQKSKRSFRSGEARMTKALQRPRRRPPPPRPPTNNEDDNVYFNMANDYHNPPAVPMRDL
ncbi:dual oxidase maturation factor 1 [Aplysia californica]|uniref:Dual oxidase maturation factor 1 n=1 Tax=Aplysia californica TaxID=6500 RepID=A0ABM1AEB7_APLCA|nr:dual oxidase maturation factor 1 [Aplysia californica]